MSIKCTAKIKGNNASFTLVAISLTLLQLLTTMYIGVGFYISLFSIKLISHDVAHLGLSSYKPETENNTFLH